MLLGFPVVVHTDHKNLTYPTKTNIRVKSWKLLLSEYQLTLHFIKRKKNIRADAFYRMRFETSQNSDVTDELCVFSDDPHVLCMDLLSCSIKTRTPLLKNQDCMLFGL